ncbi:MAG TPA: RNA polymerase sigma-70 factor [Chitinophagaceae bacterium]|jgi:RNA polymerase sigma-70 factor (ECF subfamily)
MPIENKYEETTLLVLLADDSEYAFQLLFDRYRNRIYKVAVLYVKSPVLAEEIVQDVFLKVWFQRKEIKALRSFEAWLFTVSKNYIINYLKKLANEWKARETWVRQTSASEDSADFKIRSDQFQQLLQQAIGQLPLQQQRIYKLAKEQYLSYEAIAQQLNISPLTVKTHMSRALDSIRSYLKQHGELFLLLLLLAR